MYQLTIRKEGGAGHVRTLCEATHERTANKAIWRAILLYPGMVADLETAQRRVAALERELDELREACHRIEDAREALHQLLTLPQ